jgi:membrane protease YdiL (CAAX protease family)
MEMPPGPPPTYGYAPAPAPVPVRAKPDPLPAPGTEYHQSLRTGRNRWWKGALAIAALVVAYLVISTVLGLVAIAIDLATGRVSASSLQAGELTLTPLILLMTNLTNAALIPLSMLLQWLFWGQPVRWLHSIRGYLRWDLIKRTAVVIVPVFLVYVIASVFLFPSAPGGPFTTESLLLLVIVLFTTPLQAAGEEYGARGLITRAAGSWSANPAVALVIGTVVSAAIFCLAHGAGDRWLIFYYFFFGVAMSVVVWRTGGLEVAALIHTANNLFLFTIAIIMGQDLGAGLDRSEGAGGPWVLIPVLLLTGVTGWVWWWARRHRIERTYQPVR